MTVIYQQHFLQCKNNKHNNNADRLSNRQEIVRIRIVEIKVVRMVSMSAAVFEKLIKFVI